MAQTKNNTKKSSYKHLSFKERQLIEVWHNMGDSNREIGKRLGRQHQTISNELKRGTTTQIKDYLNIYFNHQANYPEIYDKDLVDMVLTPYHETYQNDCYPSDLVTLVKFPLTPSFFKAIEMKLDYMDNPRNAKYGIY